MDHGPPRRVAAQPAGLPWLAALHGRRWHGRCIVAPDVLLLGRQRRVCRGKPGRATSNLFSELWVAGAHDAFLHPRNLHRLQELAPLQRETVGAAVLCARKRRAASPIPRVDSPFGFAGQVALTAQPGCASSFLLVRNGRGGGRSTVGLGLHTLRACGRPCLPITPTAPGGA